MAGRQICVLGTSHAAALKAAWDDLAATTGDTATFFVAPGTTIFDLEFEDEALVARGDKLLESFRSRAGGRDRIAVRDYDTLILCGVSGGIWPLIRFFGGCRFSGQDGWPDGGARHLISRALARRHAAEGLEDSFGVRVARFWSALSPARIIDVPVPPGCESALDDDSASGPAVDAARAGHGEALRALYEGERRRVLEACGAHCLEVPPDILRHGLFADRAYARSASDSGHKNKDYGRRIWEEIYRILDGHAPWQAEAPPPARPGLLGLLGLKNGRSPAAASGHGSSARP